MSRLNVFTDRELNSISKDADPALKREINREKKHRKGLDKSYQVKYKNISTSDLEEWLSKWLTQDLSEELEAELTRRRQRI